MGAEEHGTAPQPAQIVMQMVGGYWVAQVVRAMATLGLADHLARAPLSIPDLAKASGTHPGSLARLVRALGGIGMCVQDDGGKGPVRLTPLGETLRSDVPGSMRTFAMMLAAPWVQRVWEELPQAVRSGEPTFERVHGAGFWEYLSKHPEDGAIFNAAMTDGAADRAMAVLAACDMTGVKKVADVGGGQGQLLAALLKESPTLRGMLVDRADVVSSAKPVLQAAGVAERCEVIGADFFASVPSGADAYIMAQIIHDWPDQEALKILRACRGSMGTGSRLWLVEQVVRGADGTLPPDPFVSLLDLNMLMCFGAQERTADEYRGLLEGAGFKHVRVLAGKGAWSVVEAVCP